MFKEPKPVSILALQKSTKTLRNVQVSKKLSQQRTHMHQHTLKGIQSPLSNQNKHGNFCSTSGDENIDFEEDGFEKFEPKNRHNQKSLFGKDQKTNLNMEYENDHCQNDELRKTTPSKNAFEIAIEEIGMMTTNGYIEISGSYLKLFSPRLKFGFEKLPIYDLNSEKPIQDWEMKAFELNLSLTLFKKKPQCNTLIFEHISNDSNLDKNGNSEVNGNESENENEKKNILKIDQDFKFNSNNFIKENFKNHSLYVYDLKNCQNTNSTQFSILFLNYTDYKSFIKQYDKQKLRFNKNIVENINLDSIIDHLYLQIPNTVISKQLPVTKFVFHAMHIGKQSHRIILICNNNWITFFFSNGIKIYPINQCQAIINTKNPLKMFLKIQNKTFYLIEFFELTNSTLFSNIIEKSKNKKTKRYTHKGNTKPCVLNNIEDGEKREEEENVVGEDVDQVNDNINSINCNKFGKLISCYPFDINNLSSKAIGSLLLTTKAILLIIGYKIYCLNVTRNFTISFEKKEVKKMNLLPFLFDSTLPRYQIIFHSQIEKLQFALDFLIIKQSLFPKVVLKNFNQNIKFFNIITFQDNQTQKQLNKIQNKIQNFFKKEVKINKNILKKEKLQKKKDINQKTKKKLDSKIKKILPGNNENYYSSSDPEFNHKEDSQLNHENKLKSKYKLNNKKDSQSNSEKECQQKKNKSKSAILLDFNFGLGSEKETINTNSSDNSEENYSNKEAKSAEITNENYSWNQSLYHSSGQLGNELSSDQSEDYYKLDLKMDSTSYSESYVTDLEYSEPDN
ncbi:hypothetical protein M0813_09198 [Anaeramoeba flamelloides]|uniref:Uncharacterized protein n=1 Tax=Anaeramoeba flamelloides TaxID=1746091 RepID=A0ABQ8X6W7_9EUKA|nr:hypothetical protein M0813_09198 [Anaeramoeba flamelloides]